MRLIAGAFFLASVQIGRDAAEAFAPPPPPTLDAARSIPQQRRQLVAGSANLIHPQTATVLSAESDDGGSSDGGQQDDGAAAAAAGAAAAGPKILQPFLPAVDPMYSVRGPVGEDDFVVSRLGPPLKEELTNENLLKILMSECSDLEANTLVWKCMGYHFEPESETWNSDECFPKWREKYPTPPDLIGMQRIYSKEVDNPSLRANQALVKSVPADNKQSLKVHLKSYGFRGFQMAELTPNKTRRAQCANWLLYYREELFGYTVEELRERRRLKKEAEEAEEKRRREEEGKTEDEWKPPVKEVY